MAKPTHDEIIRQLTKDFAALEERTKTLRKEIDKLDDLPVRVAVLSADAQSLRNEVNDVKRQLEDARRMRWSLIPPIVGAVVSGVIAALVAYFVARK